MSVGLGCADESYDQAFTPTSGEHQPISNGFIENHVFSKMEIGRSAELGRTLTRDDIALFSIEDVEYGHVVQLVHEGRVETLMKGSLRTDEVLSTVISRNSGVRT